MRWTRKGLIMLLLCCLMTGTSGQLHSDEIGGDFTLTDHNGRPFELSRQRGKLVLLFFGYTFCPDICPTELSNLAAVLDGLGDQSDQVQGLFVSLDPQRDTPEVLRDYTRYFNPALIGLTGEGAEVDRIAGQYRVQYQRHERADGRYSLDHSANLYVIDRQGRLAAVVPYGLPPEHVLRLVQDMLAQGEPG